MLLRLLLCSALLLIERFHYFTAAEGLVEEISCFSDGMTIMLNRSYPELVKLMKDPKAQPVVYVFNHKQRVQCGTSLKGDKGAVNYNLTIPYGKPCDVYLVNLEPNYRVSETVIVLENNIVPFKGQLINHRVDCLYELTVQTFRFNDVANTQVVAASTGGRPKPKVDMLFRNQDGFPLRTARLGDYLEFYLSLNPDNAYKAILPKYCMFSDREDISAPDMQKVTFVENSCPKRNIAEIIDPLAHVNQEVFFSKFKTFRFQNQSTVFVHCTVQVCLTMEECYTDCYKRVHNSNLTADRLRFRHKRSTGTFPDQPLKEGVVEVTDQLTVYTDNDLRKLSLPSCLSPPSVTVSLPSCLSPPSVTVSLPSCLSPPSVTVSLPSCLSPPSVFASSRTGISTTHIIVFSLFLALLAAASISTIIYLLWKLKRRGKFGDESMSLDIYSAAQLRSLANTSAFRFNDGLSSASSNIGHPLHVHTGTPYR